MRCVVAAPGAAAGLFRGASRYFFANDPILEIHADSLTSYKLTDKSLVQDVRPGDVAFRASKLDGTLKFGTALPIRCDPLDRGESLDAALLDAIQDRQKDPPMVRSFFDHPEVRHVKEALRW